MMYYCLRATQLKYNNAYLTSVLMQGMQCQKEVCLILLVKSKVNELDGNIWNDLKFNLYIMVTVSDTGAGMSQELISQIFDPFSTTKKRVKAQV